MNRLFLLVLLLITCSPLSGAQEPASQHKPYTIIESLTAAGNFKTLLAALNKSGLTETLKEKGPFTLFAPDDQAFAKLPPETLEALMKDPARLKSLLLYHVTAGTVSLKDLRSQTGKSITMWEGGQADIDCNGFDWPGVQHQSTRVNTAFPPCTSQRKDDRLRSAAPPKSEIQDNGLSPAMMVINRSAGVISGDIPVSNGTIYVVDTVLSKDRLNPF